MGTSAVDEGRAAYADRAWRRASDRLAVAERGELEPADLVRLATAAYLAADDSSAALWERAYRAHEAIGDVGGAAICTFWLSRDLLYRGAFAQSAGWFARGRRLVDGLDSAHVAAGYLAMAVGIECARAGDGPGADVGFAEAESIARRFADRDLEVWARHGRGRLLLLSGRITDGLAVLDEVMIAVTTGELSPIVTGDVFCSVLDGLQEVCDVGRAAQWTAALTRWCEAQPELVAYRGRCLVARAEVLGLRGDWPQALAEAQRAATVLAGSIGHSDVGAACYEQGELHRRRGELVEAQAAFRAAAHHGHSAQPGLALLRLAEGRPEVAAAALRTHAVVPYDLRRRGLALAATVEVLLAVDDMTGAGEAVEALHALTAAAPAPMLHALTDHAVAAVALAEGRASDAFAPARRAMTIWRELDVPYEAARSRVLVALACRSLGDEDTAGFELRTAQEAFVRLAAAPDAARVAALTGDVPAGHGGRPASGAGGLTGRELEVLRLVAEGRSNRSIARELVISEKTVARHVSNIFRKLDVSSRSAATAYAYEHHLR